jgi:yeast amino acid transporter
VQLVALQNIIQFWDPNPKLPWLWIVMFWVAALGINLFGVRKLANVGFLFTVLKVLLILGLIVLGIVLPMSAATSKQELGTLNNLTMVPCNLSQAPCLQTPGFTCTLLHKRR